VRARNCMTRIIVRYCILKAAVVPMFTLHNHLKMKVVLLLPQLAAGGVQA
jgi:hypothetical protein